MADPKTLVIVSCKKIKSNLSQFIINGIKFIVTISIGSLGFALTIYLSGLTKNQIQISSFVAFINICGYSFTVGLGIGDAVRIKIGNLIGEKKFLQAKNKAWFYIFITFAFGAIYGIIMFYSRDKIASLYSSLDEIQNCLEEILFWYGIGYMFEFSIGTLNVVMRLVGYASVMIWCSFVYYILVWGGLSLLLGFGLGYGVVGIAQAYIIAQVLVSLSYVAVLLKFDWNMLKIEKDE